MLMCGTASYKLGHSTLTFAHESGVLITSAGCKLTVASVDASSMELVGCASAAFACKVLLGAATVLSMP